MLVLEHAREAARNVVSGVSQAGLLACLATVLMSACAVIEVKAVRDIELSAKEFQTSGASVRIMRAPGRVNGAACDRLGELAGVDASGAVRKEQTELTPQALRRQRIPVYSVSPRFGSFPSMPGFRADPGMAMSQELAETLGVSVGSGLHVLEAEDVRISSVFHWADDGRTGDFGFAILSASAPVKPFDECWISLSANAPNLLDAQASTLIAAPAAGEERPEFTQLNSNLGSTSVGLTQWNQRPSRLLPVVVFACMAAISYAALAWRRLELSMATHLGVGRASLMAILSIEAALWYLPSVLVGGAVTLFSGQQMEVEVTGAWWRGAMVGAVGLTASIGVAVLQASPRRLFNLFKGR